MRFFFSVLFPECRLLVSPKCRFLVLDNYLHWGMYFRPAAPSDPSLSLLLGVGHASSQSLRFGSMHPFLCLSGYTEDLAWINAFPEKALLDFSSSHYKRYSMLVTPCFFSGALHLINMSLAISRIPKSNPRVLQRVGICKFKSWQARFPNSQADTRIPAQEFPSIWEFLELVPNVWTVLHVSFFSQRIYSLVRECEQSSIRASCQVTVFVRVILERIIIVLENVSNIRDYQKIRMSW